MEKQEHKSHQKSVSGMCAFGSMVLKWYNGVEFMCCDLFLELGYIRRESGGYKCTSVSICAFVHCH